MTFEVVVGGSDSGGCVDVEWEGVDCAVVCGGDDTCSE